ncbi:SDR family NAD(P)-dependent oxidoreductase [Marinitenerispora sediminis]|uniref:Short-chain dehydrogenase n=1 Tax=Marinitenerispora sediminis TaxID=1931232 RepID=A0A368T6W9_9ACTN|nr:SDR family NAD(P)-dependent oxidoreductase [Marinitenerispora sediminis]RCV52530.1 short-chain dehydrogenase [Marinitenerispora sediminis]RCV59489.1 short-chain dehydrogenase [Marinitenerispora sediminis]RCV59596.1 short-chain dehydrogenase [Marinitenerispora sediminis]
MGWRTTTALAAGAAAAARVLARRPADLAGRVALVTGGSRGLGLLLARELGRQGCRVAVCARDPAELDRAERDLRDRGIEALAIPCDLREPGTAERLVEEVTGRLGRLDVLVNNAGIIQVGGLAALTEHDFHDAMDTMFWGPLRTSLAALPELRERRGRIVVITSIGGRLSVPHLLPYSCAKFAEVALSEGLDAELAGSGVRVTTVVPWLMRTGSHWRATFAGAPAREYTWFALAAGLPLVSMDGERAARRIVRAVRRGRRHLVLTPMARAADLAHAALPGATLWGMRAMNRLLPRPAGEPAVGGLDAERLSDSALRRALTRWNDEAGRRFNQLPDGRRPQRSG